MTGHVSHRTLVPTLAGLLTRVLEGVAAGSVTGVDTALCDEAKAALAVYDTARANVPATHYKDFEVVLPGFDGGTDATDHLVLVVSSPDMASVVAAVPEGSKVILLERLPGHRLDVTFVLPGVEKELYDHAVELMARPVQAELGPVVTIVDVDAPSTQTENRLVAALRALKTYREGEIETGIGTFPEMVEDPNGSYLKLSDVLAAIEAHGSDQDVIAQIRAYDRDLTEREEVPTADDYNAIVALAGVED